jgi:hypothetical protein
MHGQLDNQLELKIYQQLRGTLNARLIKVGCARRNVHVQLTQQRKVRVQFPQLERSADCLNRKSNVGAKIADRFKGLLL